MPLERLAPGLRVLDEHFNLRVSDDIGRRNGFLAGDDARRAEEFNAALRDPQVRAIWAARGGYGCSRIVEMLDAEAFRADPKLIIGFSDLTVLLCWAASLGFQSVHAPVLTQLGELGPEDRSWTLELVKGRKRGAVFAEHLAITGPLEGPLLGGNLSLLAHLCGTSLAPDYRDAICIIEDVGERPYALDRYLSQLLLQDNARSLRAAGCVLLGDFARCCEETDPTQEVIQTIGRRLDAAKLPWASGLPLGHGVRNRAFVFGAPARIDEGQLLLL